MSQPRKSPPSPRSRAPAVRVRPRPLPDRVPPGLRVLFVGINPGIRSAEVGHHFAGHSNRFWKLLHDVGLVPKHVGYEQDAELPRYGLGLTNLVGRPTPGVADLRPEDFVAGRERLLRKIRRLRPETVALVGVTVYRRLFEWTGAVRLGWQEETLHGARVFVLPNPSGRNAHHSYAVMQRAFLILKTGTETAKSVARSRGRTPDQSPSRVQGLAGRHESR